MSEQQCPVCEIPMHPTMARDYGGCSVDHGEIAELRAEVVRLRAAMAWYADPNNHRSGDVRGIHSYVWLDAGQRAKAAMGEVSIQQRKDEAT